jgi:23S rRNA (adenine2503-C2)-methyltransferase
MKVQDDLKGIKLAELKKILIEQGYQSFRAQQIFHWIYRKNITSFQEMLNIPKKLREQLGSIFILIEIKCLKNQQSTDGSEKFLFQLPDKDYIETVLIRGNNRNTLCLSSQVGCRWNCLFCASGKGGFKRNLLPGEIIEQILSVQRITGETIQNIVFMGMGEPFDNYAHVTRAIQIINEKQGLNIGARKITVSTCGIIPAIIQFIEFPLQAELSVSLHAADEKTRTQLMPVNKKYPLKRLIATCRLYTEKKNRQITFEYLMLKGINDSAQQASKLSEMISDFEAKVNLIIYNPVNSFNNLFPSDKKTINIFQNILEAKHIPVTTRYSRGQDIDAACGQLKSNYLNKEHDY